MFKAIWNNPQHWDSPIHIGAHHYARCLVEYGWQVAYVSSPISPFHALNFKFLQETMTRLRNWRQGGQRDLSGKLLYYTPFTLAPHFDATFLRAKWTLDGWASLTIPNLTRWASRHGFGRPDLLVMDSVTQSFWLDVLKPRTSVLRVCDRLSGFRGVTSAMLQREAELIARVDHVFYTSRAIGEDVKRYHPKAMSFMPNGVFTEHFRQDAAMPVEYDEIPAPRAVYVGAIDEWFDVELLFDVAKRLQGISFVIVGPVRVPLKGLETLRNVYLLGRRSYDEVPGIMRHAQLGLIPFQINEMVHAVNPIKLYEYFAAGLPVVSTSWQELELLDSPAKLCRSADEFVRAIELALAEGDEKSRFYDFAEQANWRSRFQIMVNALGLPTPADNSIDRTPMAS